MVKCPKCGQPMEMYERFWDYDDGKDLIGEEHYWCRACHDNQTYACDVTYVLSKRSELYVEED